MNLTWNKCQGDDWCSLKSVDLDNSHFDNMEGVYVIWHGGNDAKTVRIGQGVIRDRLAAHRDDPEVQNIQFIYPICNMGQGCYCIQKWCRGLFGKHSQSLSRRMLS